MTELDLIIPADRGCYLHPSCLACPRPVCVYEDDHYTYDGQQKRITVQRTEAAHALRQQGLTVEAIASAIGVSRRTVQRMLQ